MARDKPKKLPFTLFVISLSLHLLVFAASSHEYVWRKPAKASRPIQFRVVSVEKTEEKLPPNRQSRFLSNANRKENGSGEAGKTPSLKRDDSDLIPSRRRSLTPEVASLAPVPIPKAQEPAALPVSPKPPAVTTPRPQMKKVEKPDESKPPESIETKETPDSKEMARLAPAPKPLPKVPSLVPETKRKPEEKSITRKIPEKKKTETQAVPKQKRKPEPVAKKKIRKKVVRKNPLQVNKRAEAKRKTKEKLEMAALKPVSRPIPPQRPVWKRPQPKDPLALFRVKPQPESKPNLPKFGLSDEVANRIAKKSLSDKDTEKEEGETISLDTRDFRYASYFAHIKRRIQNAWIWPVEAQKNRGKLLLRFKLRENGTLEELRLIESAGIRILDDLALAAVTKAAPFEPFPEGLERKTITATFVYD